MDEQTTIKILEDNGGKLWEKGNMRRVYFAPEIVMSLKISRYNTGNISNATCEGERISNSEAYRAMNVKFWYDLKDAKFCWKADGIHHSSMTALENFVERMRSIIQ